MSKLYLPVFSNNPAIHFNYWKETPDSKFCSRRSSRYLKITGNSLRLVEKADFYYPRMHEKVLLHSCHNYVPPIHYQNLIAGAHSNASRECHNQSLPPISSNAELPAHRHPEEAKANTGSADNKDAAGRQDTLLNTSCSGRTSANSGKVQASPACPISPVSLIKGSPGVGMYPVENVMQKFRGNYMDSGISSSPLKITTVAFSSASNRQRRNAISGSLPVGGARSQTKVPSTSTNVKQIKVDSSSEFCLQNSLSKDINTDNSNLQHPKSAADLLLACPLGETLLTDLPERVQTSCATHELKKTLPSSGGHNNNTHETRQHIEADRSMYWQFESNKNLHQISKPQVVVKKKGNFAPSTTYGKDVQSEKTKNADKKIAADKRCKTPVEPAKPACHENINVDKIIEAVSFHRWSNKPHSYESDDQLLASSVRFPMGPTLAEREGEKRMKSRRLRVSSRSCISLLLENYKKNRQRCPSSATTSKGKRKRVFPKKKTKL